MAAPAQQALAGCWRTPPRCRSEVGGELPDAVILRPFAVILSPSLVILSEAKNPRSSLRVNSARNLALGIFKELGDSSSPATPENDNRDEFSSNLLSLAPVITMDYQRNFTRPGGELHLSNLGQLELLRAVVERGASLRTRARGLSMAPFIRDGDVLTIAPMDGSAPRIGEVIAFVQPDTGRLAIHRAIARVGAGWLVRGDNCPAPDGVVPRGAILGVLVRVEREGRDVRLGLGAEARLIAWLQRAHVLMRAVRVVGWVKGRWIAKAHQLRAKAD